MKQATITATVQLEGSFWVCIFERKDEEGYAVARKIFGAEPSDPELYQFVLTHYQELKFTEPHDFNLVVRRKNPKRIKREVRKEMDKVKKVLFSTTLAQEVLRVELEKNKKIRKHLSKSEREAREQEMFLMKQAKKKKKHRGH